ncbi:MAG: hypothetical protein ACM3X6_01380 [Patescibacteria group bacterium]
MKSAPIATGKWWPIKPGKQKRQLISSISADHVKQRGAQRPQMANSVDVETVLAVIETLLRFDDLRKHELLALITLRERIRREQAEAWNEKTAKGE